MGDRPRIGIAGIAIESSTFSPHRTGLADFTVTRDDALLARYEWLTGEGGPARWAAGVDWIPLLHARALPGGAVEADVYTGLKDEILERAAAAAAARPLDGLFFDIHGAMSVVGLTDAEADLARALRAVVGDQVLISASMDLHGNVSRELATLCDLITCYRMAPHEDAWESRERAARNLVTRLRDGRGKPELALVPVPVLLPGEKTSTRLEPARSIYQRVAEVAGADGVLDAAVWVGYAWADEPRCHAAVVVTGDDRAVISGYATELARAYWDARDGFQFVAPAASFDECLAAAVASDKRPFFISDSGDNPTAGGADDVSYVLGRLLAAPPAADVIYASIVDPAAVAAAVAAGAGATVTVEAGGKTDSGPAGPVSLTGTVRSVRREDPVGGDIAVVAAGRTSVILTSRRKPYHVIADFAALGLDPVAADIVIVKIGYLEPELYAAAADWLLALTPGGVDQDLLRLGHHKLGGPVFPFDTSVTDPGLSPWLR
ncbi:MAG TPA: M81 family metallopeptidase [Trebonia sp.]|jgi:microcystin degradation protein MlrC|nr:M81 family metallopeptidase [Trebonia sp.]